MPDEQPLPPRLYDYSRISFDDPSMETASLASTLSIKKSAQSAEVHDSNHPRIPSPLKDDPIGTVREVTETPDPVIFPQKSRQRFAIHRALRFGWWWEACSALLGVICTAMIVAILFVMNGKALADWKLPIQPNSLVAVFSTITKSALLFPLAECMGQLKWGYFEMPRRLDRLQTFDAASRGPWGALLLLWKTRGKAILGCVGALITILMLGFEPFAQQVIVFQSRIERFPDLDGTLGLAHSWLDGIDVADTAGKNAYIPFMTGILSAIADQPYSPPPNYQCLTSECRVPDIEALAICSTCEDEPITTSGFDTCACTLTDDQSYTPILGNATYARLRRYLDAHPELKNFYSLSMMCQKQFPGFPPLKLNVDAIGEAKANTLTATLSQEDGVYGKTQQVDGFINDIVPEADGVPGAQLRFCAYDDGLTKAEPNTDNGTSPQFGPTSISKSTCFRSATDLMLYQDTAHAGQINGTVSRCTLGFCAKRYTGGTVRNGQLTYAAVTEHPLKALPASVNATETWQFGTLNASNINFTAQGIDAAQRFHIGLYSRLDLIDQFVSIANPIDLSTAIYAFDTFNSTAFRNWTAMYERMAESMTAVIQSSSNPSLKYITTEGYGPEIFVHVRWPWMLMPLSVVLVSIVFLFVTVFESSRKDYLFKTSILAVLFHGLDEQDDQAAHEYSRGDTVEETVRDTRERYSGADLRTRAKGMKVALREDSSGNLKLKRE